MGAVAWGLWPTPRFPSHQSTIIRVRASLTDSSRPWGARSIASLGPRARDFRVFLIGRNFQTPSACLKDARQKLKSPPFSILALVGRFAHDGRSRSNSVDMSTIPELGSSHPKLGSLGEFLPQRFVFLFLMLEGMVRRSRETHT
jgi:hypothetical protein